MRLTRRSVCVLVAACSGKPRRTARACSHGGFVRKFVRPHLCEGHRGTLRRHLTGICKATVSTLTPSYHRRSSYASGMSSLDGQQALNNTTSRSPQKAIRIDCDFNLYFTCFPEGAKPPVRPQSSIGHTDGGQGSEIYCGTDEFVYQHFFADFGPLHLGHVWAFCRKLRALIEQQGQGQDDDGGGGRGGNEKRPVYVYSSDHPHRRSNAAVLVLAYAVICLGKSVEDAYTPFYGLQPPLIPYRDASFGVCTYHLEVLDCVRALARAASLAHVDLGTFDAERYAFYDKLEHGDLNWIIPGKFVAFSGPLADRREVESGKWTLLAEDYVPIFRKLGVTCVIRFNKRCYDRRRFTERGIKHIDLFYEDGGNPSEEILQRFLKVCENTKGAIAVHCKAGLGRTGTNIALYMMKHHGYTAAESIALCRICRPGSIVGPQQQFLHDLEHRMRKEGEQYRRRHRSGGDGSGYHADTHNSSNVVTVSPVTSVPSQPENLCAEHHFQHQFQPHLRIAQGVEPLGGGGRAKAPAPKGRRPTSSPLLMRRHSTSYSGAESGAGVRHLRMPAEASRRYVGSRRASVEEDLVVSGVADGRGFRRNGSGRDTGRGRGRGRRSAGSVSDGLQRPRRGSSPLARARNGEGGVRGEAGDVGTFMEALRLGTAKGADEGGTVSGRAEAASASTARGKLAPLAAAYARPITSTGIARSGRGGRMTPAPAVSARRKSTSNDRGISGATSTGPSSDTPTTNVQGSARGLRPVARGAAVPNQASLAWDNPVDIEGRRTGHGDVDRSDRAARGVVVSQAQGGQ